MSTPPLKSRSFSEIGPDEILVWSDKVKEQDLGITDPRTLSITELAYVRWLSDTQKLAFNAALPNFIGWIEGRPKGRYYNKAMHKGRTLLPHQCEWRATELYERKSLEALLGLLKVTNLDRHTNTPNWYVRGPLNEHEKTALDPGWRVVVVRNTTRGMFETVEGVEFGTEKRYAINLDGSQLAVLRSRGGVPDSRNGARRMG